MSRGMRVKEKAKAHERLRLGEHGAQMSSAQRSVSKESTLCTETEKKSPFLALVIVPCRDCNYSY